MIYIQNLIVAIRSNKCATYYTPACALLFSNRISHKYLIHHVHATCTHVCFLSSHAIKNYTIEIHQLHQIITTSDAHRITFPELYIIPRVIPLFLCCFTLLLTIAVQRSSYTNEMCGRTSEVLLLGNDFDNVSISNVCVYLYSTP